MIINHHHVKTVTQMPMHLNNDTISTIKRWVAAVICLVLISGVTPPSQAAAIQSQDEIRHTVENYLQLKTAQLSVKPKISVSQLDNRLRLVACSKPLEAFMPDGSQLNGRTTVGVRCRGNQPWSIYVPASISVFEEVAVATSPLMRGHIITPDDVHLEKRETAKIAGAHFIQDPAQAVGKALKRPVSAGKVIQASYLTMPRLIKRGQIVTILAETNGLVVRMNGKSMMDGAEGDLIRVQNPKSKKVVNGTVTASGEVRVNL